MKRPLHAAALVLVPLWGLAACTPAPSSNPADTAGPGARGGDTADPDTAGARDTGQAGSPGDTGDPGEDPYADELVSYTLGEGGGYGEEDLPEVVLGCPSGEGDASGSTDVLSLGCDGEIVLAFDDLGIVDGEGPDLLVFENAFSGWPETGVVAVSADGETWWEWACDPENGAGGYPGCAGVEPVYAHCDGDVDATDPEEAGGDAFDLADLALALEDPEGAEWGGDPLRYVRIRDSGANDCGGTTGGFDLDAVAVVNAEPVAGR